jgi:hypothetical protein
MHILIYFLFRNQNDEGIFRFVICLTIVNPIVTLFVTSRFEEDWTFCYTNFHFIYPLGLELTLAITCLLPPLLTVSKEDMLLYVRRMNGWPSDLPNYTPRNEVARGIMFLTRPSVCPSVRLSVRPSGRLSVRPSVSPVLVTASPL